MISTCHYSRLILINIQNQGRDKPQGVGGAQVGTGSRDNIYHGTAHARTSDFGSPTHTLSVMALRTHALQILAVLHTHCQ